MAATMTRAYPETLLSRGQALLGEAFNYAVNACGIPGADFASLFCVSSASARMENGETAVIAGKSGAELVLDVLWETTGKTPTVVEWETLGRSAEYWVGWAVAYYQWYSGRNFSQIFAALPFDELREIYHPLHEAGPDKFAEVADARVRAAFPGTNLKRLRAAYGCSQAELARLSGVGLRSIQMYEQRNKDINKASAETVYALSRALGCRMEDLLER